jgi:hypothetical protein
MYKGLPLPESKWNLKDEYVIATDLPYSDSVSVNDFNVFVDCTIVTEKHLVESYGTVSIKIFKGLNSLDSLMASAQTMRLKNPPSLKLQVFNKGVLVCGCVQAQDGSIYLPNNPDTLLITAEDLVVMVDGNKVPSDKIDLNLVDYVFRVNPSIEYYSLENSNLRAEPVVKAVRAPDLLGAAKDALDQRAALRDSSENGERSIKKTVAIFNAWSGLNLTEREGWMFMVALKQARESQGKFHEDDYVDGASYFALLGEACAKETQA